MPSLAFDWVRIVVVRAGSAAVFSEFGTRHVNIGDVVVIAPLVLCGAKPEGRITTTSVLIDPDFLAGLAFWKYADYVSDPHDAKQFLTARYSQPVQLLRLGNSGAGRLLPALDELARLSHDSPGPESFHRAHAWLSLILDVIVPHLHVSELRVDSVHRQRSDPSPLWHRPLTAVRPEARRAAELMRADVAHRWSLAELSAEVHLSPSQLGRVFRAAFGRSPIVYLTVLRVEKMASMLRRTRAPVTMIAREVGWRNADFATRQFYRTIGTTPSAYRAMIAHVDGERTIRSARWSP